MAVLGAAAMFAALVGAGATDEYAGARAAMVQRLRRSGVRDQRILEAMGRVPRHLFATRENAALAYEDSDVAAGEGEVILNPIASARLLEALDPPARGRVLVVGVRSGYEVAVIAHLSREVYVVSRHRRLLGLARSRLTAAGCRQIRYREGEPLAGWPEAGAFDAILVTFPVERPPAGLLEQLRAGGRLVFALGTGPEQTINRVEKGRGRLRSEAVALARIPASPELPVGGMAPRRVRAHGGRR